MVVHSNAYVSALKSVYVSIPLLLSQLLKYVMGIVFSWSVCISYSI